MCPLEKATFGKEGMAVSQKPKQQTVSFVRVVRSKSERSRSRKNIKPRNLLGIC